MMGVAVGLLVLVIVTTVGMLGLSAFLGFNNDNATKKIQQLETDIKTTEASIEELNKKTSVGREISTRTITIVNRNAAMVNVIESIKSKIPSRLWLKNVIIGDNITLEGESLDYSSILTFSKGFSNGTEASAINNMTLENIEEFNEQGVRVYKFTMVGQLKL